MHTHTHTHTQSDWPCCV